MKTRMKEKICVLTGSRAEYGLLRPLMDKIRADKGFELQIIATSMHLSHEFGLTYREIENDGFTINEKVEILLSSDSSIAVSKAIGLGCISLSESFARLAPDLIILLGDRFETFAAAAVAHVARIPIAHLHGGELTEGASDDAFRHAITKMSALHFTSTDIYRRRVIQLGEQPNRVFNVGAIGLDNIIEMKWLTKKGLETSLNFALDTPYFVVTFHPVTLENQTSEKQIRELLRALDEFKSYKIVFTKANADNDGRIINNLIDEYVAKHPDRAAAYFSLGQSQYLSALKYSTMMIGNSSSGIIEMPFFKKPTVNIGDRQKGRISSESIIQCKPIKESVISAIKKGLSKEFSEKCKLQSNIYGDGKTSLKIKKILKDINLQSLIKKEFYNIR